MFELTEHGADFDRVAADATTRPSQRPLPEAEAGGAAGNGHSTDKNRAWRQRHHHVERPNAAVLVVPKETTISPQVPLPRLGLSAKLPVGCAAA